MHIFPLCTSCGLPIGDVAGLFQAARAALVAASLEAEDVAPAFAPVAGLQIECGQILDGLGVTELCCRVHLMSGMEFHEIR